MAGVVVIFLVARYEQRSPSASIPTGEAMFEIGQRAPWITEFLAIFLGMMAKWLGWPFRESEPTSQANENNEEDVQGQGTRAESIQQREFPKSSKELILVRYPGYQYFYWLAEDLGSKAPVWRTITDSTTKSNH